MTRFLIAAMTLACAVGAAAQPATPSQRLRGTIEKIDGSAMVLK